MTHCEIQLGLMWFKQSASGHDNWPDSFPSILIHYASYKSKPLTISHRSASGSHAALSWLGDACQEYERWQSPAPWSQRTSRHTVLRLKRRVNEVNRCLNSTLGGSVAKVKDLGNVLNNSYGTLIRYTDRTQMARMWWTSGVWNWSQHSWWGREGDRGLERGEMIDRWREMGQRCESREYITMLVRGEITKERRDEGWWDGKWPSAGLNGVI